MTNESVFLHGVVLSNFRGIGDETAFIGPFSRFNFLIGPNNAGKSSVLGFIAHYLKPIVQRDRNIPPREISPLDIPIGKTSPSVVRMGVGVPTSILRNSLINQFSPLKSRPQLLSLLDRILTAVEKGGLIWLERKGERLQGFDLDAQSPQWTNLADYRAWNELWNVLTNKSGGSLNQHWIPETLHVVLHGAEIGIPKVNMIPAIREISPKGQKFTDWTGTGLIEELARLQNPGVHEREQLEKFKRINKFLQSVTDNTSAMIEIPHDREHVLIHMDDKVLPLESLGTGIHEVVMLAAFCTLMEEQIVCIEEPEIHLHPVLQRRFIQYLEEQTDNQYFIATHSPSIIDTPNAAVFHVTNQHGQTKIAAAMSANTRFGICRDLGYKASDLLQANAIIWVEGPSDRIYIRHWISLLAPELREGIDYSIMFYGGRLLSHLSVDESEVAEDDIAALIAVRQLNRNLAVIMDSDKAKNDAPINATKTRILEELKEHSGVGWLTEGREIENYVPTDVMSQALEAVYRGKYGKRLKSGQYDHVLPFRTAEGKTFQEVDKVRVAKAVCERMHDLGVLDLSERITSLVEMIRAANK